MKNKKIEKLLTHSLFDNKNFIKLENEKEMLSKYVENMFFLRLDLLTDKDEKLLGQTFIDTKTLELKSFSFQLNSIEDVENWVDSSNNKLSKAFSWIFNNKYNNEKEILKMSYDNNDVDFFLKVKVYPEDIMQFEDIFKLNTWMSLYQQSNLECISFKIKKNIHDEMILFLFYVNMVTGKTQTIVVNRVDFAYMACEIEKIKENVINLF